MLEPRCQANLANHLYKVGTAMDQTSGVWCRSKETESARKRKAGEGELLLYIKQMNTVQCVSSLDFAFAGILLSSKTRYFVVFTMLSNRETCLTTKFVKYPRKQLTIPV